DRKRAEPTQPRPPASPAGVEEPSGADTTAGHCAIDSAFGRRESCHTRRELRDFALTIATAPDRPLSERASGVGAVQNTAPRNTEWIADDTQGASSGQHCRAVKPLARKGTGEFGHLHRAGQLR